MANPYLQPLAGVIPYPYFAPNHLCYIGQDGMEIHTVKSVFRDICTLENGESYHISYLQPEWDDDLTPDAYDWDEIPLAYQQTKRRGTPVQLELFT